MTDYWNDRRPPSERLPDCERLLEAAQDDISRYRGTIDILHRHIKTIEAEIERLHRCIRIAAESTDSFMRANEQLRAERNELLDALKSVIELPWLDLLDDSHIESWKQAEALLAKMEPRDDE